MAVKTGATALYISFKLICGTLKRYRIKFLAINEAAHVAGAITTAQRDAIATFIAGADVLCDALGLLAAFSTL